MSCSVENPKDFNRIVGGVPGRARQTQRHVRITFGMVGLAGWGGGAGILGAGYTRRGQRQIPSE